MPHTARWSLAHRVVGSFRSSFDHCVACDDLCCATIAVPVQPCASAGSAALRKDHAPAPLLQSFARRAPQRPQKKNSKRDILRRTAMHASHRRELLVPREKKKAC